ncbi:MAG: hypothetical protein IH965_11335 [Gemmatimonadetes bacterium]|nr:hypothetical protein [Gemmatimonadota bacterium]
MSGRIVEVGARAARSLTVTAEHVAKFAEISGDYNPLHSTRTACPAHDSRGSWRRAA